MSRLLLIFLLIFLGCKPKSSIDAIPRMVTNEIQLPQPQNIIPSANADQSMDQEFTNICKSLFSQQTSTNSKVQVVGLVDDPSTALGLEIPQNQQAKFLRLKNAFPLILDKLVKLPQTLAEQGCTDVKYQSFASMLKQEALKAQKAGADFLAKAALNLSDLNPSSSQLSQLSINTCKDAMIQGMKNDNISTDTTSAIQAVQDAVHSDAKEVIGKSITIAIIVLGSVVAVYGAYSLRKVFLLEQTSKDLEALRYMKANILDHTDLSEDSVKKIGEIAEDPLVSEKVKNMYSQISENIHPTEFDGITNHTITNEKITSISKTFPEIEAEIKTQYKTQKKMRAGILTGGLAVVLSSVLVHQLVFNLSDVQSSKCDQIITSTNSDLQRFDENIRSK